jgi:hypothetical protein
MSRLPVTTRRVSCSRVVLAALAGALALVLGACSTTPARFHEQAWRLDGAPVETASITENPAPKAATTGRQAEEVYEYRGGRDPKTGRARIQM